MLTPVDSTVTAGTKNIQIDMTLTTYLNMA